MPMAFEGPFWPRLEVFTFAALLLTACVTDLRTRRIPNQLVVFAVVAGLVLAMATELERLGIKVEPTAAELRADETLSSLTVFPNKAALRKAAAAGPVSIHTYEDHRMAMSFGVLGSFDLFGDGRPWIAIEDPACTGKTFPHFFKALEALRTNFVRVTVDGGAASGKSSTSRRLAQAHGLLHVDTGAHYRSITRALLDAAARRRRRQRWPAGCPQCPRRRRPGPQ